MADTAAPALVFLVMLACGAGFAEQFDFESGFAGWVPYEGAGAHISRDGEVKHSGSASLRLTDRSEWGYVGVSRVVAAVPEASYCLTAMVRTLGASGPVCIYLTELPAAGSRMLRFHVIDREEAREWAQLERVFTTTPDTARIRIELCAVGFGLTQVGTAWFDEVALVRSDE